MANQPIEPIEYTLVRSKRRTPTIQVKEGELIARAPMKLAKRDIDRFIESKRDWITDKLTASKERVTQRNTHELTYGSLIPYRGQDYPIIARTGDRVGFDNGDDYCDCGDTSNDDSNDTNNDTTNNKHFFMPPNLTPEEIKTACIQIYKLLAKAYIPKRTLEIAEVMGLTPSSIKITSARTRWGSCNSKASINFSYRLILAPDDLIAYVIAHELAHTAHLDHSSRFWAVVANFMPDHKQRRARLKELQRRLHAEGW